MEEKDLPSDDVSIREVLLKTPRLTFRRGGQTGIDGPIELSSRDKEIMEPAVEKELAKLTIDPEYDPNNPDGLPLPSFDESMQSVTQYLIDCLPDFIFYDTFTDLLPPSIIVQNLPTSNAVADFQKVFGVNFEDLVKADARVRSSVIHDVIEKATMDLNAFWKQKQTTKEDDKYQYDIQVHPNESDPPQSKIEFLIHRNDGSSLYLQQKSKGFQWFSSFNLRLKALGVDVSDLKKYVILIDEPGQGLHETAQNDVKEVLEELAERGMQLIYSTHNSSLIGVDGDELLRIRLVQQSREEGTKIYTLPQFSTATGSKDAVSPIITAMGISHVGKLLDQTQKSVVVEGITDQYYLSALKDLMGIKEEFQFIPACGVDNLRPLVSIVLSWGGEFRALFDDGTNGKRVFKDVQKHFYPHDEESLKKQIRKLDGFDGIEDLFTPEDFDQYIVGEKRKQVIKNSELAKSLKKELLARNFLEFAKRNPKEIKLAKETLANFKVVFDWLNN